MPKVGGLGGMVWWGSGVAGVDEMKRAVRHNEAMQGTAPLALALAAEFLSMHTRPSINHI